MGRRIAIGVQATVWRSGCSLSSFLVSSSSSSFEVTVQLVPGPVSEPFNVPKTCRKLAMRGGGSYD